ncbi:hypothetical protein PRUPE_6G359100 [Prunus persica]|uniref:Transmembrane protein n=2 Tax=Prunus persica TaxID=3760 RepID=A0A251P459_PRUPE|nr:uncharacterized protein LOC18772025 isoform X1 [Prunus persica]XP_020422102.1 uncharacterized protein LOC18772025 isoform X1 [Prunus persica]XP_020422103.1 uncharacterized protein LOC18772025 isoform X1 [Prunus persica]ONI05154.1 hypothetical protein PRUPE_6G359100 [Prunus persica]ONI05155.1 hypothetical protein PRUPE_6G359100 [Prunus persica]
MSCPSSNSIRYNGSHCTCAVGYLLNQTTDTCVLFTADSTISTDSGISTNVLSFFPETIFSFDSIKKFTQSQAVFLEATLVFLLSWLFFCFFLRFMKLGNDGRSIWFRLRWWISRLDVCFSTRHWLDDQKVVKKRKTELGGTFSIASWILFIGLFAALLYQIITKRTIEVHNVRATNAPDLASFNNDMEFNITTISSMSCSNLRDLATLVTGNPGFIDFRVAPLSTFGNYSCQNTSRGPMITLRCNNCQPIQDNLYISWQFIDLPNNPAAAVGFQFNLSTRSHANKKHVSFVSGTLKNGSTFDDRPVTFRGNVTNILKFSLFPRIYRNLHGLKHIQPLFHDFVPGSFFRDTSQLQTSLESSNDGILNATLYVNFLSAYIVEIDNRNIMGPVSFLADLGGLYCICIGIFFYLLVQCEFRIKKLRNEDSVLRKIRNRRKAQDHWDKLRKYVMYTWGCKALNESEKKGSGCIGFNIQSVHRNGSSHKQRQQEMDTISFNRKLSLPNKKTAVQECSHTVGGVRSFTHGTSLNPVESSSHSAVEPPLQIELLGSTKDGKHKCVCLCKEDSSLPKALTLTNDDIIPPPVSLELKDASEMDMSDVQKNLRSLYEYNVMLREKLIATQSLFHSLPTNSASSVTEGET